MFLSNRNHNVLPNWTATGIVAVTTCVAACILMNRWGKGAIITSTLRKYFNSLIWCLSAYRGISYWFISSVKNFTLTLPNLFSLKLNDYHLNISYILFFPFFLLTFTELCSPPCLSLAPFYPSPRSPCSPYVCLLFIGFCSMTDMFYHPKTYKEHTRDIVIAQQLRLLICSVGCFLSTMQISKMFKRIDSQHFARIWTNIYEVSSSNLI